MLDAWTKVWLSPAFASWTLERELPLVRCLGARAPRGRGGGILGGILGHTGFFYGPGLKRILHVPVPACQSVVDRFDRLVDTLPAVDPAAVRLAVLEPRLLADLPPSPPRPAG